MEYLVKSLLMVLLVVVYIGIKKGWLNSLREGGPGLMAEITRRRSHQKAGLSEKSVTVAGKSMWYLDSGSGKTVVLLLHGFGGEKEQWNELASLLVKSKLRVVAPDLPGFGRNEKDLNTKYSASKLTKAIRQFVREVDLERFHIVGHSIGAIVAASYAYASPIEVLSLGLFEPLGLRVPYESELDKQLTQGRNPLITNSVSGYESILKFMTLTMPPIPAAIIKQRGERLVGKAPFYQQMWKDLREGERANLLDLLLPELKTKTLVLVGDKSRVVHEATPEVAKRTLSNAAVRTVIIPQSGHLPMLERPEATAEAYLGFLTGQ